MPTYPDFSKLLVPNAQGVPTYLYNVKDEVARTALAGGMKFVMAWKGNATPDVTKIPNTVTVLYNGTAYNGTLKPQEAHEATPMGFWLVSNMSDGNDSFSEYVPVEDTDQTPSVWSWEKVGDVGLSLDDLGLLAYQDSVELDKGSGVNVIGENATLQSQDSAVTFGTHTTKPALGTNATFRVGTPGVTNTKGRIKSESMTGLNGTETQNVTLNPSKKKMKRRNVIPAKSKTIEGSELVKYTQKKLSTKTIYTPNAPSGVNILNDFTKRKLETKPFPVSVKQEGNSAAPPTPYGFSVQMYDSSIHGTVQGADDETLVLMFNTTPTLVLDSNAPARLATGGLVADGDNGTQAHTDYTNEQGGEIVNSANKTTQNMVTGRTANETVADGTLTEPREGDTDLLVDSIDTTPTVDVAEPDTPVQVATGELAASGDSGYNTTPSGPENELVTGASPTVTVPKAGTAKQVLIEEWANADNDSSHINVVKNAALDSNVTVEVGDADQVNAITDIGAATAAAQQVSFASMDLKKVARYDDLKIRTESHPATRYLNFVTPSGGTIILQKTGSPSEISLEYSIDGVNWTGWNENNGDRSVTVSAGDRLYVRSTSPTTARFSSGVNNYYKFVVPNGTSVYGMVESLICRTPELGEIGLSPTTSNIFTYLFYGCKIKGRPVINSKTLKPYSLYYIFYNTQQLNEVEIHATSVGEYALNCWLAGVAGEGTVYAPQALSLPDGNENGLPSGWTRVDI